MLLSVIISSLNNHFQTFHYPPTGPQPAIIFGDVKWL